jgi:hypothetical protein
MSPHGVNSFGFQRRQGRVTVDGFSVGYTSSGITGFALNTLISKLDEMPGTRVNKSCVVEIL